MSSTLRRAARREGDFYATPPWAVHQLIDHYPAVLEGRTLDAGCGSGAIMRVLADRGANVCGIDNDPDRAATAKAEGFLAVAGDFLTAPLQEDILDGVIANPPYRDAVPFIERALGIAERVTFLLRLNFLGSSRSRLHLLRESGLARVDVLSKRPSFVAVGSCRVCNETWWWPATASGEEVRHPASLVACPMVGRAGGSKEYRVTRTDSCDYAWFTWERGSTESLLTVFPLPT